jgi:hypothetical protein
MRRRPVVEQPAHTGMPEVVEAQRRLTCRRTQPVRAPPQVVGLNRRADTGREDEPVVALVLTFGQPFPVLRYPM